MLGEQDLRDLSCTGACTVIVCAGMCHLAQQYWLGKGDRREECALDTSKRRFAERMWSLVTQDSDMDNDLVKDLGSADHQGVYKSTSAVNPLQAIYLRRAPSTGAFEWSVEKLVWLPTCTILDDVLSIDHEILIRRLEAERLLTSSKLSLAQPGAPITHPPELDLPQSLKVPENLSRDFRVPQEFRCPLGSGVMSQPVVAPSGLTYDRAVIEQWVARFHTDPATGSPLQVSQLYPNLIIRDLIQAWIVSNADKLDPALVERVTRESVTPGSFLTTPVSDHTPLAFNRTSSFGLGSEHASSMALDAMSTHAPTSATSAAAAAAAAPAVGAAHRGSAQHSTELIVDSRPTNHSTAAHTPRCQPNAEGGHRDHTPTASEAAHTPVASLMQRRHSTALSGRSSAADPFIPATSQQEFSPMGTAGFPAGLMCPPKHYSSVARHQGKRVSCSNSLPAMQCPASGDVAEEGSLLSLSAASPLCCRGITDAANISAQETGCDTARAQNASEKSPEASVVAGDVLCQQRLLPVKLPSRAGSRPGTGERLSNIVTDSLGNQGLLETQGTGVVSPGYQEPWSWDSDQMLRATAGGVKLASSEKGEGTTQPPASAELQASTDRADEEELDRLIA